jgi:hypothetical protein
VPSDSEGGGGLWDVEIIGEKSPGLEAGVLTAVFKVKGSIVE